MNNFETDAIVLNTFNIKEKSKILKVFSRKFGKIDIIYSNKNPLQEKTNILDIFSEIYININISNDYIYLLDYEIINSFYRLRNQNMNILYSNLIFDLIDLAFPMYYTDVKIYDLTIKFLETIENKKNKYFLVLAYILKFLAFLGYRLNFNNCNNCGNNNDDSYYYSIEMGGIICNNCKTGYNLMRLSKYQAKILNCLMYSTFENISDEEYSDQNFLLGILVDTFKNILDISEIKSLKYLNLFEKGLYGK